MSPSIQTGDIEAQLGASRSGLTSRSGSPHQAQSPTQLGNGSISPVLPQTHGSPRPSIVTSIPHPRRSRSSVATQRRSTDGDSAVSDLSETDEEAKGLFLLAGALRNEEPPGEPWFLEMTTLRRMHFLYLNKRLAAARKKILEGRRATDQDLQDIGVLLHEQAEAIRDFQYIKSLDFLTPGEKDRRQKATHEHFPHTGTSIFPDVDPFETENYRCLPRHANTRAEVFSDEIREWLRKYLPVRLSWTNDEKRTRSEFYQKKYMPTKLSPNADRLARFIVAMFGALFILVPIYIMALQQNRTKSLITTTVAVVLFAIVCSITLRATNDQTLGSTAAYAAVLVVFVGLTNQ